jgi:tyrocidine synthetase-3
MSHQDLHINTLTRVLLSLKNASGKGITFIKGNAEEDVLYYDQLIQEAMQTLGSLQQRGINNGDELILQVEDNRQFILLFWACLLGRIIPVPLSTGSQDDHKLKLLKVYRTLNRPHLVCDKQQLERLEKYADENDYTDLFQIVRRNSFAPEELESTTQPGIVQEADAADIAYIQFSSGSTGEPKGVILTHANLVANITDIASRSGVGADDRMLSWMPLTHDMGLICFHLTGVIAGVGQYLMPTALFVRRPVLWIEKANEHKISLLYSPNFGYSYFLAAFNDTSDAAAGWDLSSIRVIYNGAEPISHELCERFIHTLGRYGLRNTAMYPGYGMAEASVAVCLPNPGDPMRSYIVDRKSLKTGKKIKLVDKGESGVSFMEVGYPIPQCRVRITDDNDNELKNGCLGHIQIAGANVTAGYYNNEAATEKVITTDGWLRTGDLGFFINERLVITGRAKNIIILYGQNYYPQDIERAVEQVKGIGPGKAVACGVKNPSSWKEELVLFIMFKEKLSQFVALLPALRNAVADQTGLTVDTIIPIARIPKTTSGKVQHFKLTESYQSGQYAPLLAELNQLQNTIGETLTQPAVEAWLIETCNRVLEVTDINATDNLFDWGITSLQATRLASYIKEWSGKDFSVWEVLSNPTITDIAELIITGSNTAVMVAAPVVPLPQQDHYPVSEGQRRFWTLHQHEEAQPACNISVGYKLKGSVNRIAFEKTLKALTERHESLRTTFIYAEDNPVQVIHSSADGAYDFEYFDLSHEQGAEKIAGRIARYDADSPFDLENGPLWRCKLMRLSDGEYIVAFTLHHIISDGWSVLLALGEINTLYNAYTKDLQPGLSHLRLQAKDHVFAQLQQTGDVTVIKNQEYWANEFHGELPVLELPFKNPRPPFQTFQGHIRRFSLSAGETNRLNQLSRKHEATLFMTLLGLVNVLFYKYTGQTDIIVGTDTSGRDTKDLEKQIGYFLRTLPIRTRFDRTSHFADVLNKVKGRLLNAYKHQQYSFDRLLKDIDLKKDISRSPLFDVLVIYQNFGQPLGIDKLGEANAFLYDINPSSALVDLHFEFSEHDGGLAYNIRYNSDLFSAEQVERMGHHFSQLARNISLHPDLCIAEYEMLTAEEKRTLIHDHNNTETQYDRHDNLVALFEEQVAATPGNIAVRFGGEQFNYEYINAKANQFAHFLVKEYGVKQGTRIGLLVSPSEKMIIQIMAIYKAGAIFVPLSTEYPAERIKQIVHNSGIQLICADQVTSGSIKHLPVELIPVELFWELAHQYPQENPVCCTSSDDIAYIMYTSGSTGTPKGVIIQHEAVLDYVQTFSRYFNLLEHDIVIQQSELTFDTAVEEIFPALSVGAAIVVMSNRGRNVDDIIEAIEVNKATILSTTPLVLNEINQHADSLKTLRVVISGGDKLRASFVNKLIKKTNVYNTYGPTESTVCATFNRLAKPSDVSIIGRPIANRKVFILDQDMKPVAAGVKGEIYIAGKGLAAGYQQNTTETERQFIDSPFAPVQRLYKTGDMGRWLEDGKIEFLGRKDSQVKINGYRVEISEVEQAMISLQEVTDVAVETCTDRKGNKQLVVFYTGTATSEKYFRSGLMELVPHYMVPSFFIHLDAMPVNTNGKTDRKALPFSRIAIGGNEITEQVAPSNKAEEKLLAIWEEVLGEPVGDVTANFFELGGNSIDATRIATRILKEFDVKILLKYLFIYPTIREQATLITGSEYNAQLAITPLEEKDFYEVSNSQKRLWLLDQFKEAKLAYNLSWAFRLQGDLDYPLFEKSMQAIIERHEILRTNIITVDGTPKQKVRTATDNLFSIDYSDLRHNSDKDIATELIIEKETNRPFDLVTDSLVRASMIRLAEDERVFVFVIHHIIADGWSMQVFVNELATLYNSLVRGEQAELPALSFQYKDFTNWQNENLESDTITEHKDYWLTKFSGGSVPVLELPTDYLRPLVQTYNGKRVDFFISADRKRKLSAIGAENDTTLFVVLLSAVYTLLYKYTRQEDIVIGTPVIGREREELENQIGLYLNTLALRTRFRSDESFRSLLNRVRATVLQAYEHQSYPFDHLVDELSLVADTSRSPLFDVMVGFQDTETTVKKLNTLQGLTAIPYEKKNVISQFDLSIDFFDREDGLSAAIEFNTDLFKPAYVERLVAQYITLLDAIARNAGMPVYAIDYIPEEQKKQLLGFNGEAYSPSAYTTIVQKFEEQAALHPGDTAVVYNDSSLTYKQLNERANQLAHYLRQEKGVKPNDVIGLFTGRSVEMIVYLLGILKSGAAYLPIDADYLSDRIDFMVSDCNMKILLSASQNNTIAADVETVNLVAIDETIASYPVQDPVLVNKPTDLTYIIYTSGSTGKPKGVMVQHRNLVSVADSWTKQYALETFPVCSLQMASISFDVFTGDLCRTLLHGGKLVICPSDIRPDTQELYALINKHRVSMLESTPALIIPLMNYAWEHKLDVSFIKLLIIGSDNCLIEDYKGLQTRFGSVMRIINSYGTTETTIDSSFYEEPLQNLTDTGTTPIGKPLANTQCFVLDDHQTMLPIAIPGELCIGGAGVSVGYLNDEELQKKKFIPDPFNRGAKLYRTGDIVRWLDDGNLQFLGRRDFQVKIRGYRIELGEIEDALLRYEGVRDAVVLAKTDGNGEQYLVGYYVMKEEAAAEQAKVRNWLQQRLPGYMVPSCLMELAFFPLTSNGKIDRKALPAPSLEVSKDNYVAPRTATEQKMTAIWEEVLNRSGIGIEDNFFEWGGHSLKAAKVIARIHKELGVKAELRSLFTHPTIAGLCELIATSRRKEYEKITPVAEQHYYELSHAQRRLWILEQVEEDRVAYNMPVCYRLEGELNREALVKALYTIIDRHEILRTRFVVVEGEPWQKVHSTEASGFKLQEEDISSEPDQQQYIQGMLEEEKQRPFDLEKGPLLRGHLLQLSADQHMLLFNMHHIISDGWSVDVLAKELTQLYNSYAKGEAVQLSPLPIQYRDYSAWQSRQLSSAEMQEHGNYWKEQFKQGAPVLGLPTDYTRPATKTYKGATIKSVLNKELSDGIKSLSLRKGTSVFISLLSAIKILLYRYTGQQDIVIGFPVSGRDHGELEGQIGFYVNTLALRTSFEGDESFERLLSKVNETTLNAYSHQQYPFDVLVEQLDLARDLSRSPLFDVLVVLQNTEVQGKGLGEMEGLQIKEQEVEWGVSKFDLTISFTEQEDGVQMQVEYNADLFVKERIERLVTHYQGLWKSILNDNDEKVSRLDYLSAAEKETLISQFNDTAIGYPSKATIQELFEQRVKEQPDTIAVINGERSVTYRELNEKANQLAHWLRRNHNISRDTLVGLMVERSEWMIIGIMGILKAGAAYVPVDPEYPADRQAYLLQDASVSLLITDDELTFSEEFNGEKIYLRSQWDIISAGMPVTNGVIENEPHDLAYVIYTSGSSGLPKGVLIEHQNVVRLLFNEQFQFDFSAKDIWTVFHSMCFDFSVWEIFGSLLYGGKLVIVPKETAQSPRLFAKLLEQEKVTVLNQVPGVFNNVVQEVLSGAEDYDLLLRYVIFGGEALNPASLSRWYDRYPETRLINMYGITETTVHTTYKEIGIKEIKAGDSNIGKAIPTVELYLADKNGNLVPEGIAGEILVGGLGVARGYLNRPELTTERFINNPWKRGERLYRSGDLGRRLPIGELVYMGRGDFQVKIRGYRIELGEIEDAILRYEGVRDAVVLAKTDGNGEQYLVGYYVMKEGAAAEQSMLRNWLQQRLPGYMVPSCLMELAFFPLTSNGKIDRKALPAPSLEGSKDNYVAPRTVAEQKMTAIWEEVLNRSGIGIEDNFFEWGGHSLKAAKVIARIHKELGVKAELRSLFTHPTIAGLCELIATGSRKEYEKITSVAEQQYYELSHAQRRLWILEQVEEDKVAYNMPVCYRLEGELNREALVKALYTIIDRHEILRTRFVVVEGEPWQKVYSTEASGFKLQEEDITTEDNQQQCIQRMLEEEKQRPFDLEKGPLLRSRLLQLSADQYMLLFNMHHIISDGWSVEVLVKELTGLYNSYAKGEAVQLSPLPIQYRDYSAWQSRQLASAEMQEHGKYWKEQFKQGAPVLGLPTDYTRPAAKTYKGATVKSVLNKELSDGIKSLSRKKGTSIFISLLSAIKILLYRYTGQQDIVIGFPVSGRDHGELEGQIGFYVNTLALKTSFEGDESFERLLSKVNETTLNAYSHQQYPFDVLVEQLDLARDLSRSPIFDVLVVLQNTEVQGKGIGEMEGLQIKEQEVEWGVSKFDLTISFTEQEKGVQMQVEYNADLFVKERIERLVDHYQGLWRSILNNNDEKVSRLDYLSAAEKETLVSQFNDTAIGYPSTATIQELFEQRVKEQPDAIAVINGETTLTYRELNEKSNQLAHYLWRNCRIGRDMLVGLMVERSEWMIIGIMGILKAGAAYVPIDPEYPETRRRYIAEDSGLQLLLTEKEYLNNEWPVEQVDIRNNAIAKESTVNPVNENYSSDRAYIIYTSGTTGKPKGAQVEHRSVINLNAWLSDIIYSQQKQPLRVTLTASISFDSSVKQLFPSLLNGSALVIISAEERKDPTLYIETIKRNGINLADMTPSYLKIVLQQVRDTNEQLPSLYYTLSGGESLSNQLAEEYHHVFAGNSKLVNVYGVTEATVDSTYEAISDPAQRKSQQSIGKPIHNTQLYILDANHNLLPVGIPGTLYIGGDGLSRGYINKIDLTNEKFVTNTITGSGTIYNTGDMARWMADGTVEFLGRNDRQVKIRAHRIELDEIEQTLLRHESVKNAAVIARKDKQGASFIVAYFSENTAIDTDTLRTYLSVHLPAYMLPASLVRVDEFARTANGKLDYNALPETDGDNVSVNEYVVPSNETEQMLVNIWEELLDKKSVSTKDNFFHIGGDSLKAMKLFANIYKQSGVRLPIKNIFTTPTVQELARVIGESKKTNYTPIVPIAAQEHYELSHSQKRLWILNQFEKDQTAYNIPVGYIFSGQFKYDIFTKALTALVERHETLRTSFIKVNGEPRQIVHEADDCQLAVEYIDIRENGAAKIGDIAANDESFDLRIAPLMRVKLLRTAEEEHICYITLHHIISDAWSNNNLITELSALYNAYVAGRPSPFAPLPVQYKDYAVWQKENLSGQLGNAEQYWMDQFAEFPPFLEFPTGKARPRVKTFDGDTVEFDLTPSQVEALTALGNSHNATLFMVLVAISKTLLHRYTAETDIVITTPTAGRDHPDLENQVGFYVNTLALRTRLQPEEEFTGFLSKVKETVLGAYTHQSYPFDMLTDKLDTPYDPSHAPLTEIMVILQNAGQQSLQLDGMTVRPIEVKNTTSRFDLSIFFTATEKALRVELSYNTSILDKAQVTDMAAHLNQLIATVIQSPETRISQLPSLETNKLWQLADKNVATRNKKTVAPKHVDTLVSATFTAEPMGDYLLWWSKKFELDLQVRFSGYNQVFRDLLDPGKTPGIHILLVRFEDFIRDKDETSSDDELIGLLENSFEQLTTTLSARAGTTTYITGLYPISPGLRYSEKVISYLKDINNRWAKLVRTITGVYAIDFEEIIDLYGITDVFDAASDRLGHIPFTETFFAATGTSLARKIRGLRKPAFKVIALDCDNTLWKGICGEEGAEGVQVTGGFADLQRFMLKKFEEGFLLVLNSKNNEADVWEVFEKNSGMLLKKEHFVAWRINWNNKSDNLTQIAAELNLDANSFCFIDDSATECAEVMTNCPRALTLELPEDPDYFTRFLQHVWAFDKIEITEEDKQRNEMYISERKRQEQKKEQTTLDEYLAGLELQVSMQIVDDESLQRVSQLTDRTNQFNLRKKHYSPVEIRSMMAAKETTCWTLTVQDKFGDYGLTGAVISKLVDDKLYIDTLLLSCRVLGRHVEQAILYGLKKYAGEHDIKEIIADYWPTAKNLQVAGFLENTGWQVKQTEEKYTRYAIAVDKIPDEIPFIKFFYNEALPGSKENKTKTSKTSSLIDRAFIPDHIGIAVADMETAGRYYSELGYSTTGVIYDPIQNVHLAMYTHDTLHAIELVGAHDEKSPVNNILRKNGDIPYHICYRVRNLEHTLQLLNAIGEYEVISEPQQAVLFGGKRVMFISVKDVGLIELLEYPELTINDVPSGITDNVLVKIVAPHLDKASLFYTRLGYYEDRISGSSVSRNYSVLLKHKYYPSCLEIIMPGKTETSPENEFLAKNGAHLYRLALSKERTGAVKKQNLSYMHEWHENIVAGNKTNWEWNQRLVNEQELLHITIYESLKYNSAQSLTRIPLYNLASGDRLENVKDVPKTDTQRRLCSIWEEILHQRPIGMTGQFFKLGGNSIKATQVLSRIENQLGVEISLSQFFENDTLQELAVLVDRSVSRQNVIKPLPQSDYYDISNAQKRLWIANKLEKNQVTFNIPAVYCIEGKFNTTAMGQAMMALIQRHESLRTTFTEINGIPKQKINDAETCGFALREIDLRNEPDGVSTALLMARESSLTSFDLEHGPLIRATVYRIEDNMYIFSQVVHHIVFDGWSVGVEMEDMVKLYNQYNEGNTDIALSPLPVQYKEFAAWENEQLQGEKLAGHRNYWLNQFDDEIPRLDFPSDYSRPQFKTNNGAISSFLIEGELLQKIKDLMNAHDTSLFMLMIAAVNGVLYRFTGQQDMVVGMPYSNRHHSDLEDQIGFYVNLLPVRTRFSASSSFNTIIKQVKQTTLQAYDHGVYPFNKILEDLRVPADLSRSPLFDVMVQMQNANVMEVDNSKYKNDFLISPVEMDRAVSKYDLLFNIIESSNGIHIDIEYSTDLFKQTTIDKIKDNLLRLFNIVATKTEMTMSELRKQLMDVESTYQVNYDQQIIAEIEQDF